MVNTVGLIGHNGALGSLILAELTQLHAKGDIVLVVIHRPNSALTGIPDQVEHRALDFEAEDGHAFDEAVGGINILVSAIGGYGTANQVKLYPAFLRSKSFVTFILSEYGPNYTLADRKRANISGILSTKITAMDEAVKANLPKTVIQAGVLTSLIFRFAAFGFDIKENQIWTYKDSQNKGMPLVSPDYLAKAVTSLVTRDPSTLVGQNYHVYELTPSGAEIAKSFTEVIGNETTLVPLSEDQVQEKLQSETAFQALAASIFRKFAEDDWQYLGQRLEVAPYKRVEIEQVVRAARS